MLSPAATYHCEVKELPSRLVLSIRMRTPKQALPQRIGQAYGAIAAYMAERQLEPAGEPFLAYYNADMKDLDIEAGFPVARKLPGRGDIQCREIVGGKVAACLHVGPYNEVGSAFEALNQWLQANNYQGTGVVYEFYLSDPAVTPPEALKTEVAMPLKTA